MKFSLIFFLLNTYFVFSIYSQNNKASTLNLILKGKVYDEVQLRIMTFDGSTYTVSGISPNKVEWSFEYPDTIYNQHTLMKINGRNYKDSIESKIIFNLPLKLDTVRTESFTVNKYSTIEGVFLQSNIIDFSDTKFLGDHFLFNSSSDETFITALMAMNEGYSLFWKDSLNYDQRINKYIDFSSKYSNSHFLISMLYATLARYKTKEDVLKVFNSFSLNNKQSFFGTKITEYLDMNFFENSILPDWQTHQHEPIINDTSKYNLVIFSASWCGPCHEQIPNLKKIHADLQEKLNMTYVSIDESETVEEWKKLMKREQIPWRSLLAKDDVKGLQSKYFVHSIPLAFLVFPNGKIHRLQLYEEKDRKLIYAITNLK